MIKIHIKIHLRIEIQKIEKNRSKFKTEFESNTCKNKFVLFLGVRRGKIIIQMKLLSKHLNLTRTSMKILKFQE